MKALTFSAAGLLALVLALPSSAQTPATAKSPQSLCKAGEMEFMTAWKAPEGPGGWSDKPAKQTLSVCVSGYQDLADETIHLRWGTKKRLLIDKAYTGDDMKFELALGNGHDLDVTFGVYDPAEKYSIREAFRMDSTVELLKNGQKIGDYALFDPQFKPYVGRGMIGLLEWIAARREQRSATYHVEWAKWPK